MSVFVRPPLRPAFVLLTLAAPVGLFVSRLSWQPETDPQAALVRVENWKLTDLLGHLESRGLGFRALPTFEGGSVLYNAFLVRKDRTWKDVKGLIKDSKELHRWKDVVYCERVATPEAAESRVQCWGDACLVADRFVFFGDPELLVQIRSALSAGVGSSNSAPF
jgi:hypothetical protein